ncbi:MAG: PQQ-binding-like beta-propeller repeat protein, partial [Chloroflexota bacterium]
MKKVTQFAFGISCLALVSCGGGDDNSSGPPTAGPPPPAPTPTLSVTLSESTISVDVDEGETQEFSVDASFTGNSTDPIIADIEIGGRRYQLAGDPTLSGSTFSVNFETVPFAPGGMSTSQVTFRLCTTSACDTVYPGSTQTLTVELSVDLDDWETFQRNAKHDGYLAVAYNAADFGAAWNVPTEPVESPTAIAANDESVFFNVNTSNGRIQTRAVNPDDAALQWSVDLGPGFYRGAPSVRDGRVISASMDTSSVSLPIQLLNEETGQLLGTVQYASQFAVPGAIVQFDGAFYLQSGYYGNVVFAWNSANATEAWQVEPNPPGTGFVMEGQSVAADEDFVYYYGISGLYVLDRTNGTTARFIADPFFAAAGISYRGSYYAAPILTDTNLAIAFSGNKSPRQALPLNAYDLSDGSFSWRTGSTYVGT